MELPLVRVQRSIWAELLTRNILLSEFNIGETSIPRNDVQMDDLINSTRGSVEAAQGESHAYAWRIDSYFEM